MKIARCLTGLAMLAFVGVAFGHGEDELRSGEVKPRIGVMSDIVVMEKFKTYGYTSIDVTQAGETWVVRAQREGQPVDFKINALTGGLREGQVSDLRVTPQATQVIQVQPQRTPWRDRAIKFDAIGIRGLTPP